MPQCLVIVNRHAMKKGAFSDGKFSMI